MLPLHNNDGDGRRMVEYYRGLLMAFDRLKQDGISTNVYAWNVSNTTNVSTLLAMPIFRNVTLSSALSILLRSNLWLRSVRSTT